MRGKAQGRQNLLEAIQGHYATGLLHAMIDRGVLRALDSPQDPVALAREFDFPADALRAALEYLATTTNVVARTKKGRYRLGAVAYPELAFQIGKFAATYGRAVETLGERPPDYEALGRAYAGAAEHSAPATTELLAKAHPGCLVDLGCGPATLLIELAARDPNFEGIGLDSSPAVCRIARQRVREAGLNRRIRILRAHANDPTREIPDSLVHRVDTLHGASFLNAYFRHGDHTAIEVLKTLAKRFPERSAWFVDYYGRLHSTMNVGKHRLTLLQDLAQVVSGQGVPPASEKQWRRVFRKARFEVGDMYEVTARGLTWFLAIAVTSSPTEKS